MPWHAYDVLHEPEPGHWELHKPQTEHYSGPPEKYADIRLVRRGDGTVAYRCLVLPNDAPAPMDGGLQRTLRDAAGHAHQLYVRSLTTTGPTGYPSHR